MSDEIMDKAPFYCPYCGEVIEDETPYDHTYKHQKYRTTHLLGSGRI